MLAKPNHFKVIKESATEKNAMNLNQNSDYKIAILDWDDTMIPTTQLFKNKQPCGENITTNQLHNIGKLVYQLLLKYIALYGRQNIFIVTNAQREWVYLSLHLLNNMYKDTQICINKNQTYFEAAKNLLISQTIYIISGRDLYEKPYPKQTAIWKHLVFKQIITHHYKCIPNNSVRKCSITSIGDSMDEFIAAFNVTKLLTETYKINPTNVILHRIKLKYHPSINEMTDEIRLILALSDALYREVSISQTIDYEQELRDYKSTSEWETDTVIV